MIAPRPGRGGAALLAVGAVWCAGLFAPDLHLALLYLAPALLLAMALLAGRYPGERALERIAARRAAIPARGPRARDSRRPPTVARSIARGGLLLAHALAGRAPPAAWGGSCPLITS